MAMNHSNTKRIVALFVLLGVAVAVLVMVLKPSPKPAYRLTQETVETHLYDMVYGSDTAPVKAYAYLSYHCVHCRNFYTQTFPLLKTVYIDKGKLQLIVKLVDLTHDAQVQQALKTLVCLNQFGNPEPLHRLLLAEPNAVYTKEFLAVTDEFIDKDAQVAQCMLNGEAQNYLEANYTEFKQLQLTGTPTFVIDHKIYKGFKTFEQFKTMLDGE